MPVTAPERNAIVSPACSEFRAASAVRTLARTEMFMPMKPVAPDSSAPMTKATAGTTPRKTATSTATMTPTIAIAPYCRRRYAPAPSWIAAAISCIRALPGDAPSTCREVTMP